MGAHNRRRVEIAAGESLTPHAGESGVSRQLDAEQPNFRIDRDLGKAGQALILPSSSRTHPALGAIISVNESSCNV